MFRLLILLTTILLSALRVVLRSRSDLVLENIALRQQVEALKRRRRRPQLDDADRAFWLAMRSAWRGWAARLILVQPIPSSGGTVTALGAIGARSPDRAPVQGGQGSRGRSASWPRSHAACRSALRVRMWSNAGWRSCVTTERASPPWTSSRSPPHLCAFCRLFPQSRGSRNCCGVELCAGSGRDVTDLLRRLIGVDSRVGVFGLR